MPLFEYRGCDSIGKEVTGSIEASSESEARATLHAQQIERLELFLRDSPVPEAASGDQPKQRLSTTEAELVIEPIARLSAAGLPLAAGLRAAAAESTDRQVTQTLNFIAQRLDEGQPLDEITNGRELFPKHVSRIITTAARSGDLGHALREIVNHHAIVREIRWSLTTGLAYPLTVSVFAIVVLVSMAFLLVPKFERMFAEFALESTLATRLLVWWVYQGVWVVIAMFAIGLAALTVLRWASGRTKWMRLVSSIPLFGALSFWSGIAEWSSLMSVLLHQRIPLPEALRLAGNGIANEYIGQLTTSFSRDVEQGHSISESLGMTRSFPATATTLIRWGEENGMLSESFSMNREMFVRRIRGRTVLLRAIVIPLLFVAIVGGFSFLVSGLFAPLVNLIQGLS